MMRHIVLLVVATYLITSAAPSAQVQQQIPRFEDATCPVSAPSNVRCGYLVVPEDRSQSDSRLIRLAVAIIKAPGNAAPDPVVFLSGGPGASALSVMAHWLNAPARFGRDFIILEQRGTRYSQPNLACPEISAANTYNFSRNLSYQDEIAYVAAAAQACRDRLSQSANLADYNSVASAADLANLRQLLGYKEWNLYGQSYGTRLALTAMRDQPDGIRSVILDSTYPPNVDAYSNHVKNFVRALDVLFANCAADQRCANAYPDLKMVFYRMVAKYNATPLAVTVSPPDGAPFTALLSGDDIVAGVMQALYSAQLIPYLPFLIYQLDAGNADVARPLLEEELSGLDAVSQGQFYSVECREEIPFNDPAAISADEQSQPQIANFYPFRADPTVCGIWGVPQAGAIENQAVRSDIPTLVLAGSYDPITPPSNGKLAAATLSHSYYFEFPTQGHAEIDGGTCPRSIILAFLNNPSSAPSATCISSMPIASFIVPADIHNTPALYNLSKELDSDGVSIYLVLMGVCTLVFLMGFVVASLYLLRHRNVTWQSRAIYILAALLALVNIVFVITLYFVVNFSDYVMLGFGIPASATSVLLLPYLSGGLAVALLLLLWVRRKESQRIRIFYTLVAVAAMLFVTLLGYTGFLGLTL